MKKLYQSLFLFLLLLICSLDSTAQLYPVQLTPIFNIPYAVKISDYANSMDTKMQLLINPTDISIMHRQVRLKFYIQGSGINVQSSDYIQGQRPIFINGGELQTLTNTDIAALFRLENLQGISAAQYAGALPEGMYNFCFEVYDFVTNQKLSQKSCAMMYLQLNDPPILNIPSKNEQITATDFPNILFTWTPRQINATNVSYKFELKQLIDPTLDPQFAFQMSPPLYEETLYSTALLYNLSMPILTPGMRYAWRVKAISTSGLSENSVFKNDGYSEIFSFKYASNCGAPTFLLSQAQSSKSARITWQSQIENKKFHIQYRTKGIANAKWFSVYTQNNQVVIANLEPESSYEFRVGATCDAEQYGFEQSYVYSNIQEFKMPAKNNTDQAYNCGIRPTIHINNQTPLTNLIQSETFTAGDFPVTILELKGKNPYSGKGYIVLPYLADTKIAVEFNNITINTDYQLISGVVETSYDPDWGNVADVKEIVNDFKGLTNEIAGLFNKADELIRQKEDGTLSQTDFDKKWAEEVYAKLEDSQTKYEKLVNNPNNSETVKEKVKELKAPLIPLASTTYNTVGNQTKSDLKELRDQIKDIDELLSKECDAILGNIVIFLATEKVNYLKLAASEVSKNTASFSESNKTYKTSVYDEENGTLKITHYKGWSNSNPVQNLFLIETKDAELNKLKITKFWLSYAPNNVDANAKAVDVVIYFKDPVPDQAEPFCTQKTTITKGISTQAQFADAMEQMVFYSALGMGSVEALGSVKATECISGFALDAGFQMGINAIVKRYLNESFTTKQLMKEVSLPSAAVSCATAALVNQCGTACAGVSGFAVGFGDDVVNQLKSGKSLSEVEISQSTLNGIKQGILNIVVQKVVTFGIAKFTTWKGKYTAKQVEDALEDLRVHPEKYGIKSVENAVARESWNGVKNIFKANVDEIAEASIKIKNYRALNNLKGKNIGYLDGIIEGKAVDNKIWLSGEAKPDIEPQIFKAIEVEGTGGRTWLRNTDSEYKMLNKLASELGSKNNPNIKGEVKIISELEYCNSCQGVIQQFNEMFPNIKLILIDGAK